MKINKKVQTLWHNEGQKVQAGDNDPNSAAALIDNMEEYAKFRTNVELRHLFSKYNFMGKNVLDVGCGPGRLSFEIANKADYVFGIDFSDGFIEVANKYKEKSNINNIDFESTSLEELKTDKRFDTIFFGGVMMYMSDDEVVEHLHNLKENILVENGDVLIREPISYLRKEEKTEIDTKRTPEQYISLFQRAGFKLTYTNETFMHSPFFRFYERLTPEKRKKKSISLLFKFLFKINSLIDPVFLSFGESYKKRVSKNWTIKQKYFFFKAI